MSKMKNFNSLLYSIVAGFLFACNIVFGRAIYAANSIAMLIDSGKHVVTMVLQFLLYTALGTGLCFFIWYLIDFLKRKRFQIYKQWRFLKSRYVFWGCWLATFLAWLPCYLSYYPGILSYDSNVQTLMARRIWPWTTHHPPIHTFLWKVCLSAGYKIGIEPIVIYSLLQMLVLSGCLAFVIKYLINRGCNNFIVVFAFCFFAFNPVIAILSFAMTKDIYFAAALMLMSINLLELVRDPNTFLKKPVYCLSFVLFTVISCLLRNNFIYAYILLFPILFIMLRKASKKVFMIILAPIVLTMLCTRLVYPFANIEKGDTKESLSVPMQQIALVAETEALSEEVLEEIERYIPDTSVFNPRFADPIKFVFSEEEFNQNSSDFFRLWFKLFIKYPTRYIDAFLSLNIPLWYTETDWIDPFSERMYIETYIYDGSYTFERNSILPGLYEFYEKIADGRSFENLPGISCLLSINMPVWILLFTILYLLTQKENKKICVPIMYLFLWLTYMAGPVSCLRYIFPVMLPYPIFLWMILEPALTAGSD